MSPICGVCMDSHTHINHMVVLHKKL